MAERIPLVVIDGQKRELPNGDTLKGVSSSGEVTEESAEEIAMALSIALG